MHGPQNRSTAHVSEQAAEWFVRLYHDDAGPNAYAHYASWLRQSPEHVAETLRVLRVFAALRRTRLERLELDELDADTVVALPLPRAHNRRRVQIVRTAG